MERKLKEDYTFTTDRIKDIWFVGNNVVIQGNLIIIKAGFEWNGCTGARDNKKTYYPSCVHDALCIERNMPISQKTKDLIFLDLLKKEKFMGAYMYYAGVRLFGKFFVS